MSSALSASTQRADSAPPPDRLRGPAGSSRVTWIYLATGMFLVLAYPLGPQWLRAPIYALVVMAGITSLVIGIRRHAEPGQRRPWWAMLGVLLAFLCTLLLRGVLPGAGDFPPPLIAMVPDAAALPAYLLMAYSFVLMLRRRQAGHDDPAGVDALLVGLGAAFIMWTFLVAPQMDSAKPSLPTMLDALFPVLDVVLLVLATRLLLAGGVRQPALWLLIVCAGSIFVADLIYALRAGRPTGATELSIEMVFLGGLLLPGAAALHPSMRTLTEPQDVVVRDLGVVRTATLAVVLIIPPVIIAAMPATTVFNRVVQAVMSVLVTSAVIARVVRAHNSRVRAERSARWRATHDALTDLPNRELLAETITAWGGRATEEGNEISLLFIDLDRFKMVNDRWGHQVGDELLCVVAGRLGSMVRSQDLVCRIGGDEFVVALASPSHDALADSLARRMIDEFAAPFELSVGSVVITPSIGIARSRGAAAALELIRDADTAMYKAKGSGRNAFVQFDSSLRDQVRVRMDLEQALRGALERGEIGVHYQPIVDLQTDELDGFEALMRWNHPRLGAVSPLEFIPIAEDTGLIVQSGAWLLRQAVAQLVGWRAERPADARVLHVSVNLSVRQLRDAEIVGVVREVLVDTGLEPTALWLEITESGVMEDLASALATLHGLRELGVILCIDDFGTGYSSLSYLGRLPVGILKIDRSFVAGVGAGGREGPDGPTEPIVRAVLAMTEAMDLRVVAEGVETVEQRDWLRERGCGLAQGWLYGAPRPPEALGDWIQRPRDAPRIGASADA